MSFGASTASRPYDRRQSDFMSILGMGPDPLTVAPLSQDNLAHNHHYGTARAGLSPFPVNQVQEGAIPSWIFNSSMACSPAMAYGIQTGQPSVTSSFAQADPRQVSSQPHSQSYQSQPTSFQPDLSRIDSNSQPVQHTRLARQDGVPTMESFPAVSQPSTSALNSEVHNSTSVPVCNAGALSQDLTASSSSHTSGKMTSSPDSVLREPKVTQPPTELPSTMETFDSVNSWMASNAFATSFERKLSDTYPDEFQAGDLSFKTSADRRERNKASQRESRKRKQNRLETLEDENAELRKALSAIKQARGIVANNAGVVSDNSCDADPVTKFSGAIHLDGIESHLEDDSAEAEWSGFAGHLFQGRQHCASDDDGNSDTPSVPSSGDGSEARAIQADEDVKASRRSSCNVFGAVKQRSAKWELSVHHMKQRRQFPSMVVVPELNLYKVCRLYFSIVLPFTTNLKSGIINLRAAQMAPGYLGGCDDLPRFQGHASLNATADSFLPKNLMPTEMQLRVGFHPVEIAVVPHPAMRDKLLTMLNAFQSIDHLARESDEASDDEVKSIHDRIDLAADTRRWGPSDADGSIVRPDKSRAYIYGFADKPKGSHRLKLPAQQWLNTFFVDLVMNLRIWSPGGDIFDLECFEFLEPFIRKYTFMVDEHILRSTNRWRRARGEVPIRL